MALTIEEKASLEIWWMLREIKHIRCLTSTDKRAYFSPSEKTPKSHISEPEIADKWRILRKLADEDVIKIWPIYIKHDSSSVFATMEKAFGASPSIGGYEIELQEPKFTSYLDQYQSLEELEGKEMSRSLKLFPEACHLAYNGQVSRLRPNSLNLRFCISIFKHPALKPLDWSEIAEGMSDDEVENEFTRRQISDTAHRLNKQVKKDLGIDELFVLDAKTIRRLL